jgi:hypothetical protein
MKKSFLRIVNHRGMLCLILLGSMLLFTCEKALEELYQPVIIFHGYLAENQGSSESVAEVTLEGNLSFPNSCETKGDTLRMYFYSEDFSHGTLVWQGLQIRMDIFPSTDTTDTSGNIGIKNMLIDISDYRNGNKSYVVVSADTIHQPTFDSKVNANSFSLQRHGSIDLEIERAPLHKVGMTGLAIVIENATIKGSVR